MKKHSELLQEAIDQGVNISARRTYMLVEYDEEHQRIARFCPYYGMAAPLLYGQCVDDLAMEPDDQLWSTIEEALVTATGFDFDNISVKCPDSNCNMVKYYEPDHTFSVSQMMIHLWDEHEYDVQQVIAWLKSINL